MPVGRVSSKGQITLPAEARRKLDIAPNSNVEILVRDNEIVIRRLLSLEELYGIFHVKGRKPIPWEKARDMAEEAAAEEGSLVRR